MDEIYQLVFARWNFLLYTVNQLINHVDKFKIMTGKKLKPKIIIRTGVGSKRPLHPQFQHVGDFTQAFRKMSTTIEIIRLKDLKIYFQLTKSLLKRWQKYNFS